MTANDKHTLAFSRRTAPEVCVYFSPSITEGAGKAGCALHPRSRVQCAQEVRTRAYRAAEASRLSLRDGFTAYTTLSPATGFVATVTLQVLLQSLTPASGRQDHTTSPSALARARLPHATGVHRIPPHVRDDRDPPLLSGETGRVMPLICPTAKAEYFCARGWTDFWLICPSGSFCDVGWVERSETHRGHGRL